MIGVGQQFEIQAFLGAERFMRIHAVEAHTQNHGVAFGKLWLVHLKLVGFSRSTGRLVFGIEIQDDPLASVIFQADRRSFL